MATFYEVGGHVRDGLLGLKSKDIDYAVEAESYDDMKAAVVARGYNVKVENAKYFRLMAIKPGVGPVDFTLCRKDGEYRDGRHPERVTVGTIEDDLRRRDFTVNAIARTEDGRIIDPHGGQDDIKVRRLACVGVAKDRFREDGLRLLRAVRFHVTKAFWLERDIEVCLEQSSFFEPCLKGVSVERVRVELDACFRHDTFYTMHFLQAYPALMKHLFYKAPIWLKPTMEAR